MISGEYHEFFKDRSNRFGVDDIRCLGWSEKSQQDRFGALLDIGDLKNKSVLDVGCGLGDLRERLNGVSRYVGYDIMKEFVGRARKNHSGDTFYHADVMESPPENSEYDYVFASGLFFLNHADWSLYVVGATQRMFERCRIGIGVNFLSNVSKTQRDDRHYADPAMVCGLMIKQVSHKIILKHDYRDNDFTVFLYK